MTWKAISGNVSCSGNLYLGSAWASCAEAKSDSWTRSRMALRSCSGIAVAPYLTGQLVTVPGSRRQWLAKPIPAAITMLAPRRSPTNPLHPIHHIRHGKAGLLVHDDHRAAVAAPVTGPRAQRHDVGTQSIPHSEPDRYPEHQLLAVGLFFKDGVTCLLRQQSDPPGLPATGDDRLNGCHRSGVALPVGRRDLRPAPPGVVRHGGIQHRVAKGPQGDVGCAQGLWVHRWRGKARCHPPVLGGRQPDMEVGTQGTA